MNDWSKEYRKEAGQVAKETSWTIMRFLPAFILVVVVLTLMVWGLKSAGIIGKDIDREVVRHSRQFVESKQAKLQSLYTEYTNLQTKAAEADAVGATKVIDAVYAQQKALIAQMRREATNIPSHQVPPEIQQLLSQQF